MYFGIPGLEVCVDAAAPMTYQIDGTQYIVTGVDGVMYTSSSAGSL